MGRERHFEIRSLRPAGQQVEVERNGHQHALPEIPHGRHEDRPARQPAIGLHLRHVLVRERQAVELEGGRSAGLVRRDHLPPTAGIAGDGVDGDGEIGGHQAGFDQRAQ